MFFLFRLSQNKNCFSLFSNIMFSDTIKVFNVADVTIFQKSASNRFIVEKLTYRYLKIQLVLDSILSIYIYSLCIYL